MYAKPVRDRALRLIDEGHSLSEVSRRISVSRSTLRDWRARPERPGSSTWCLRCSDAPHDLAAYAALLGYYLGDGCLSEAPRYFALRVSCDANYPRILEDVATLMTRVRPGSNVFRVKAPGVVVVQAHWQHWPCLFPQHGPGRKHERPIVLEPWQQRIVRDHPGDFLRGLFHSDGSRVANWTTRVVAGKVKRYDYPRWMFTNSSDDILDLCTQALDLVGVAWRRPRVNCVAVSRAADVGRLDELIGPKG